jgi:hypothetical protein
VPVFPEQAVAKTGATFSLADSEDADGSLVLTVAPDAAPSGSPASAAGPGSPALAAVSGGTGGKQTWRALRLRICAGYPEEPPRLLFQYSHETDADIDTAPQVRPTSARLPQCACLQGYQLCLVYNLAKNTPSSDLKVGSDRGTLHLSCCMPALASAIVGHPLPALLACKGTCYHPHE